MDALIERRARVYQRKIQAELRRQNMAIVKNVRDNGTAITLANLDFIIDNTKMEKILTDMYMEVAIQFRQITARQMLGINKYRKQKNLFAEQVDFLQLVQADPELFEIYRSVLDYMGKNGGKKIKSINDVTKEEATRIINKVMAEAYMRGISEADLTKEIVKQLPKELTKVATFRAQRIARTESHAAANWSSLEEAKPLADELVKVWGAFIDADTRPSHVAADGQVRELDQPFTVGNYALMTPCDPEAPSGAAGEVINCRCTILYERKNNL
jgi:SPP1 gp7 family putative phage head morphogenesis protein